MVSLVSRVSTRVCGTRSRGANPRRHTEFWRVSLDGDRARLLSEVFMKYWISFNSNALREITFPTTQTWQSGCRQKAVNCFSVRL